MSNEGHRDGTGGPHAPTRVRGSLWFRRFGEAVLHHRVAMLAVTLGLTLLMGWFAWFDLRADTSDENFLAADAATTATLREVRAEFGDDALFQVLVGGDVFSMPYLERLRGLHEELQAIDITLIDEKSEGLQHAAPRTASAARQADTWGDFQDAADTGDADWGDDAGGSIVDELISLINVRQTHGANGTLVVEGLLERWPTPDRLEALKRRVLADRTLVGQVIDGTGTHSVLVLRTQKLGEKDLAQLHARLEQVAAKHDRADFRVQVSGGPAVSSALRGLMLSDTRLSMILSSIVMLLITGLIFRHPIGMFGPPLVVWQAEIWTLGTMALTDTPLTMVTTILPAFIGCVGLGDTVHILSVYRSSRGAGMANDEAIVHTLATTGLPVFLTTLTTAVGLLSFRLASLQAIQDMGTFGALGVIGALVNSIVFLPILLTFNDKSMLGLRRGAGEDLFDRVIAWFERLTAPLPLASGGVSHARRNRTLAVTAVVALVSGLGVARLRVYHDGLDWFPEDNPTRRAVTNLENTVGGTANLALLLEAPEGHTLREREALLAIERLESHVLAYDDGRGVGRSVRNAISLLDPIRESWRAIHDDDPAYYRLPDTQQGVRDMYLLFENASPEDLRSLATIDTRRALMTVRVTWRDAHSYLPLVEHLRAGIREHLAGLVNAQPTGSVYVAVSIVNVLLSDLLRSFGTAALVIAVLMVFLLRDPKTGALAMLPNLLPIAIVMGYMGYASIPLDTSTLMLGSVAIGIVVDDTIHFLHQFRTHYDEHGNVDAAVKFAFRHSGRAMVVTSVILVAGFCTVTAGELLTSKLFGYLLGLTVIAALVADFTFTPALLRMVYRDRPPAVPAPDGQASLEEPATHATL